MWPSETRWRMCANYRSAVPLRSFASVPTAMQSPIDTFPPPAPVDPSELRALSKMPRLESSSPALSNSPIALGHSPPQSVIDRIVTCASKIHAILRVNPAVQAKRMHSDLLQNIAKGLATKFVLTMHAYQPFNDASVNHIVQNMYPGGIGWLEALVVRVMDFRYVCDDIRVDQVSLLPTELSEIKNFVDDLRARALDPSVPSPPGADLDVTAPRPADTGLAKLGQGTYGQVILVPRPPHLPPELPDLLARKKVQHAFDYKFGFEKTVLRELFIQRDLVHPNIAQILHVAMTPYDPRRRAQDFYFDIYMYMHPMKDLRKILRDMPPLSPTDRASFARNVLRDVCTGLAYIHSLGIIHRDLKPANILEADGTFKLADFGLARYGPETNSGQSASAAHEAHLSHEVQTLWYRCPEILLGIREYTQAVDVWSVGCIAYEVVMGEVWFTGENEDMQLTRILEALGDPPPESLLRRLPGWRAVATGNRQRRTPLFRTPLGSEDNVAFLAFVSALTSYAPQRRLGAAQALLTPFLNPPR